MSEQFLRVMKRYPMSTRAAWIVDGYFHDGRLPQTRDEIITVVAFAYERGYASATAKFRARIKAQHKREADV